MGIYDFLFLGYSDDRALVSMALDQPASFPPLQSLKGFFVVFTIIFCSEGEVYDGVVCKQSHRRVFGVLCHVIYVNQEEDIP